MPVNNYSTPDSEVEKLRARIAELENEVKHVTRQRDETYAKLVEAREQIQRLTFGSSR